MPHCSWGRPYNLTEATVFGLGSGTGWMLAIVALAGVREKMKYSKCAGSTAWIESHYPRWSHVAGLPELHGILFVKNLNSLNRKASGGPSR